ncbi:hypothetical protein FHX06_005621 [Rhizobium sp. BK512]|uniref:hypothetical protein n=2 Tax=unclassified Rhizobium TaxID=2613769 RepID=UPI000DE0EEDD|nr:hypothetical protein [Rhizobium sp. BK512]MBB3564266.1 hypothetical protein [Rhizobium sp. BK512]
MAAIAVEHLPSWSILGLGKSAPVAKIGDAFYPRGVGKKEIRIMAFRPLIFGVLFIAVFVMVILSIIWVDKSHPIRQPDPLAPSTTPSNPPPSVQ